MEGVTMEDLLEPLKHWVKLTPKRNKIYLFRSGF